VTRWHYQGKRLVALEHPTQSERYQYDARGFKIAKIVTLKTQGQELTAITRYHYNDAGSLQATSLPDGSHLVYERNGQGQVVAIQRSQLQTPWLQAYAHWLLPAQTLVQDLQRDIVGLKSYTTGNGIQVQYQRSTEGKLARVVYKSSRTIQASTLQTQAKPVTLLGRSTQDTISALLGVGSAYAADAPASSAAPATSASATANTPLGEASKSSLPGALGLPQDSQALIDHRYLWDTAGNLLYTQSQGAGAKLQHSAYAYDRQDRLIIASSAQGTGLENKTLTAVSTGAASAASSAPNSADANAAQSSTSRYHYQQGRRVLAQENIGDTADMRSQTRQVHYQAGSHRWLGETLGKDKAAPAQYNANGQPGKVGQREYVWNALGQLTEVRQEDKTLASYSYNHRAERVGKTITSPASSSSRSISSVQTQHYLYEDGQLAAELDAQGQIERQYLYLADQPIAVIDTPEGRTLSKEKLLPLYSIGLDAKNILKHYWSNTVGSWLGSAVDEQVSWLHTNHLGAPEAATDSAGQLIWQARYAPFGAAKIVRTATGPQTGSSVRTEPVEGHQANINFTLNLRLPGQYEDAETGLFYNKQRYYDPARGEYLTPDPLGTPDGPNGYAYVRYNPLKYVDPDGLILFAFDGTDNTDDTTWLTTGGRNSSLTNVVQFRNAYNDGARRYVSGVGTDHALDANGVRRDTYTPIISSTFSSGLIPDRGGNYSGPARLDRMGLYFDDEADLARDRREIMQVDIIGFSRGAAQAREFANRVAARTTNGVYTYQRHDSAGMLLRDTAGNPITSTVCVNFRFMGLWDTVLENRTGTVYRLGIPPQFRYVSQAVALNEYRSAPGGVVYDGLSNSNFWDNSRTHLTDRNHWGGFPLESIGGNSQAPGRTRVEMGFLGAHADIGGGYGTNDNGLSTVALSWMVAQAQIAGVRMNPPNVGIDLNNPVIHDQSNALRWGNPTGAAPVQIGTLLTRDTITPEDRRVNGAAAGTTQRTMQFGPPLAGGNRSMVNTDTHEFINYTARDPVTTRRVNTNDLPAIVALQNRTGTVNMQNYLSWLRGHGYVFHGDF
jgi:RHS repeat-associated protein